MSSEHHNEHHGGYEKRDVNLLKVGLYTVLTTALIVVAVIWLYDYFISVKEQIVYETVLSAPSSELRELAAREAEVLGTYGVVDTTRGQYRIPIERAMDLIAAEAFQDSIAKIRNVGE